MPLVYRNTLVYYTVYSTPNTLYSTLYCVEDTKSISFNLISSQLIMPLSHEWWLKKEDFHPLHQLTFFLSFCAGGSKALDRSAIFCKRTKWTDRVKRTDFSSMLRVFFYYCHHVNRYVWFSARNASWFITNSQWNMALNSSYLLKIPVALHRIWEFSLQSGQT